MACASKTLVAAAKSQIGISPIAFFGQAIDLVDESAARLRTKSMVAGGIDEVSRKVMQLEIEREALRKKDQASQARLAAASKARWHESYKRSRRWDSEGLGVAPARDSRSDGRGETCDGACGTGPTSESRGRTAIRRVPRLERELALEQNSAETGRKPVTQEVDEDDIAAIVVAGQESPSPAGRR
jgi:ATP-dependent Clp protease ATP-binding subunit ClpB